MPAYPFEAPFSEDQWSRMFRQVMPSGVYGTLGGTALRVSANSSGMQVFVAAGDAIVRGHHYEQTGQVALNIAANSSGGTRVDRVVSRVNAAGNTITPTVIQGQPGAGAPAFVTATDLPLGLVTVDSGAASIAANKVTDDRRFAPRHITPATGVDKLLEPPVSGDSVWTGTELLIYNGSQWVNHSPQPEPSPQPTEIVWRAETGGREGPIVMKESSYGQITYLAPNLVHVQFRLISAQVQNFNQVRWQVSGIPPARTGWHHAAPGVTLFTGQFRPTGGSTPGTPGAGYSKTLWWDDERPNPFVVNTSDPNSGSVEARGIGIDWELHGSLIYITA